MSNSFNHFSSKDKRQILEGETKTMNAQDISNKLNGKPSGSGFIARCPAHDDIKPSLSITDGDNGLTLINCFAGCSADDVIASMGLEMKDLYNDSNFTPMQLKEYKQRKNLSKLWTLLNRELHVLLQIVNNRVCDETISNDRQFKKYRPDFKPLSSTFWDREITAARRIKKIIGDIYGV